MVQPLSFDARSLNPRLAGGDLGVAFPRLVFEVLQPERPGLVLLDAPGKDGGIDLSEVRADGLAVVEAKHVGANSSADATDRWREVAKRLRTHLANPDGPTKGQSQYGPWYRRDRPIVEYTFCVSSTIGGQQRRDTLRQEIEGVFTELAGNHQHLAHLAGVRVELLDWAELAPDIERRPHIVYRWFPATRPVGVVPLDEPLGTSTFRQYLQSGRLPYFSLEAYRASHEATLLPETALLAAMEAEAGGLLITGRGGVGKTRLMLELGALANQVGWTVLRVLPSFDRAAMEQLAERATPGDRILLLVDYVELHPGFEEIAGLIRDVNETYTLNIRYVANCRGTYYRQLSALTGHRRIDVSPAIGAEADEYGRYAAETVRHILAHSDIALTDDALAVCRDTPVLAVFLSFLVHSGQQADLGDLLRERDFGTWVAKRVQMSFREPVQRELAILVALLPLRSAAAAALPRRLRELLDRLVTDGWAARDYGAAGEDAYVMAHDVLADQILLSYACDIPDTVDGFAGDLLDVAATADSIESALIALQRVSTEPVFDGLDWLTVVNAQIEAKPEIWGANAEWLVVTTLLGPAQCIELLRDHRAEWSGIEDDVEVQNRFAWLARWALRSEDEELSPQAQAALKEWVLAGAEAATSINFVITWALRLAPEEARAAAERWIAAHPLDFQTHYVLVAWLESGLPAEEIGDVVASWAERYADVERLTFVVRAWLEADGDWRRLAGPVGRWTSEFATRLDARFVYAAWLDAGGDSTLVTEPISRWLAHHAETLEAGFVYKAWLDAGGDRELVSEPISRWLVQHAANLEAGFVYAGWLDGGGDFTLVAESISRWLDLHAEVLVARFVYKAWLDGGGDSTLVAGSISRWLVQHAEVLQAGFVYKAWLDAGGDRELVSEPISRWLVQHAEAFEAQFVYKAWLNADGDRATVAAQVRCWLDLHGSREDADYVYRAWLTAGGSFDEVREQLLTWVHANRDRQDAKFVLKNVLQARGLPLRTVNDVLHWCASFPSDEDALWRLTGLGRHLNQVGVGDDFLDAARAVMDALPNTLAVLPRGQIATLISALVQSPDLTVSPYRQEVDELIRAWLVNPLSYGGAPQPHDAIQRKQYVVRVLGVAEAHREDPAVQDGVRRFLEWMDLWSPENRAAAAPQLTKLREQLTAPSSP